MYIFFIIITVILSYLIKEKDKKVKVYDSKYVSIAKGKLILKDKNVVDIYGYDDIADFLYRNEDKLIWIEGSIRENGVELKSILNIS